MREGKSSGFGVAYFERREHPRYSIKMTVEYCPIEKSKSSPAYTGNIGEGGLLLNIREELELGEYLLLSLFIDSGVDYLPIDLLVQVVWRGQDADEEGNYRTGVKIVNIMAKDRRILRNFLSTIRHFDPSLEEIKRSGPFLKIGPFWED